MAWIKEIGPDYIVGTSKNSSRQLPTNLTR
jgi:hypothetical protein